MRKQVTVLLSVFLLLFILVQQAAAKSAACVSGLQAGVAEVTLEHGNGEIVMVSYPRAFCRAPVVVVTGYEEVTRVRLGVVTAEAVTLIVDGAPGAVRLAWQGTPATK